MDTKSVYINLHCHGEKPKDRWEILSYDTSDFSGAMLPGGFFTLGIHPWHLDNQDIPAALLKLASTIEQDNFLAIGECGLDKSIGIDLSRQLNVFYRQIELSEQYSKPLVIHCVRAFNELLHCKQTVKAVQPWIIHGFNSHPQLAGQLLKHGCYLSFGHRILQDASHARQVLATMPAERLFLETDAADVSISEIYRAAAKIAGLELCELQRLILSNFYRVFLHD